MSTKDRRDGAGAAAGDSVTWGDNVIFADFRRSTAASGSARSWAKPGGGGAGSGGRRAKAAEAVPTTPAVAALLDSPPFQEAKDAGRPTVRLRNAAYLPKTTFGRWLWECITRSADTGRIRRGEEYFAHAKVAGMQISNGFVAVNVEGSQLDPFSATIYLPARERTVAHEVFSWLVQDPLAMKRFERGDLPFELMEKLFCAGDEEFRFDCTCPDLAPCCKHVIAGALDACTTIDASPWRALELRGWSEYTARRHMESIARSQGRLGVDNATSKAVGKAVDRAGSGDSAATAATATDHDDSAAAAMTQEEYWGAALPRIPVPEVDPIDPLQVTNRSLLHEALAPTCVISYETLRAVSDLEDCWHHLKESTGLVPHSPTAATDT